VGSGNVEVEGEMGLQRKQNAFFCPAMHGAPMG